MSMTVRARGHFFLEVKFVASLLFHRFLNDRFLLFREALSLVHDVLDVLVDRFIIVLATRTLSAKREDHAAGTVQMFLNVCIFLSL